MYSQKIRNVPYQNRYTDLSATPPDWQRSQHTHCIDNDIKSLPSIETAQTVLCIFIINSLFKSPHQHRISERLPPAREVT